MELLKSYMSDEDAGILLDDDIIMTRYILPDAPKTKWSWATCELNAEVYTKKLQILMQTSEANHKPYFTTNLNYRIHSAYDRVKPLMKTYKWSGFFGFFKRSENPFDVEFSVGADADAQFKLVYDSIAKGEEFCNVLQDTGLILATDYKCEKYHIDAEHDRTENYAIINTRYPGITTAMKNNICNIRSSVPTKHLNLDKKVLNKFKKNFIWRLRGENLS